jgi:putative oxidoreductase
MEVGLFLIHAVIGSFVAAHGSQKLFGIVGGHGLAGTAAYLEGFGLRPGRLFAFAAGSAEFVGGLAFAAGLFTPGAAALIAATMLIAAGTDHSGKGFWIYNGGSEYVLTNASVAIALAFFGAGQWSVDNAIGWDVAGVAWGLGALGVAVVGAAGVLVRTSRARVSSAAVEPSPTAA